MAQKDTLSVDSYHSRDIEEGLPSFLENLNLQACEELDFNNYREQDACSALSTEYISYCTAFKCQRDGLVQVMCMEAATTSCLVLASRRGKVSLMSGGNLEAVQPIANYNLPMAEEGGRGSKSNVWLSDAALMLDASAVVYSVSDRTLHFFDTSCSRRSEAAQEHRHIWKVVGMKNCVTSVCYSQSSGANSKSTLYLGDEQGNIAALTFLQPAMLLFSHKGMETQAGRAETIYWPELFETRGAHAPYVHAQIDKKVHAEPVLQMTYCPLQQAFVSCSLDPKCSIKLRHANRKLPTYTFSLDMGIRCFSFHPQRFEIASGSDDGVVRIWNPIIPKRPILNLCGHETAVVDVLYVQDADLLLSICRNAELRIWGVSSSNCLKVLQLETPATYRWNGAKNLFLWRSDRNSILVSLGPALAEIGLSNQNSSMRASEICSARSEESYSPLLHSDAGSEKNVAAVAGSGLANAAANWRPTPQQDDERNWRLPQFDNDNDSGANCLGFRPGQMKMPHIPISAVHVMRQRMESPGEEESGANTLMGINERIEKQDRILAKRRFFVEECAPHLALSMWSPDTIAPPKVQKVVIKNNFKF